jgi:exodeoxyribonuclease-3
MVSIATWNINSVRLRIDQVERFLAEQAPDVLCLQEIKTAEELFPHEMFERLGYTHRAVHGQKGYHGVATVSRVPFREIGRHDWQDNGEARHVGVELLGPGQGCCWKTSISRRAATFPTANSTPSSGRSSISSNA